METKTIELNEQEANILVQLLDIAVRTSGLKVAQPALGLAAKVEEAFKKEE
jgi:hypothetical protein